MAKQGVSFTTNSSSPSNCCRLSAALSAGSLKSCVLSLSPSALRLHPTINLSTPSHTPLRPPNHLTCHPSFPLFLSPAIESNSFIFGFFLTFSCCLCFIILASLQSQTEFASSLKWFPPQSQTLPDDWVEKRDVSHLHPNWRKTLVSDWEFYCFLTFQLGCELLKSVPPPSQLLWLCWQLAKGPSVSSHPSQGNQSSHPGSIRWLATAFHGKSLNHERSFCYTQQKQHWQLKHAGEQIALSPLIQVQSNS